MFLCHDPHIWFNSEECYLLEACKEVLHSPRFSTDSTNSELFCQSAETIVSHGTSYNIEKRKTVELFSDSLQSGMEDVFGQTLKLSRLWPAFHKYSTFDKLRGMEGVL